MTLLLLAVLAAALIVVVCLGRAVVRWTVRAFEDEEALRYLHDQLSRTPTGYRPPTDSHTAMAIHRAISRPGRIRRDAP